MGSSSRRPLKVGLYLPAFDQPWANAPTPRWADLLAAARRAEAVGFDSVWLGDHLLVREPDEAPVGIWECWSLLAALAAATGRIELGFLVGQDDAGRRRWRPVRRVVAAPARPVDAVAEQEKERRY